MCDSVFHHHLPCVLDHGQLSAPASAERVPDPGQQRVPRAAVSRRFVEHDVADHHSCIASPAHRPRPRHGRRPSTDGTSKQGGTSQQGGASPQDGTSQQEECGFDQSQLDSEGEGWVSPPTTTKSGPSNKKTAPSDRASERGDNEWEGENLLQDIDAYERGDGDGENPLQDIDASLRPTDDLLLWAPEECEFFCHDKSRTAHNQGVQLLGTNIPLRPMQMDVVYRFLRQCFRGDLGGGIMALDTGLGKTIIALAIIAVMRLAELNFAEVQSEWTSTTADGMAAVPPRRHNQQGEAGPCPSGNRWSIQCCCVAGSLTLDIALKQGPGPSEKTNTEGLPD